MTPDELKHVSPGLIRLAKATLKHLDEKQIKTIGEDKDGQKHKKVMQKD